MSQTKFSDLGLKQELLDTVAEHGYETPSPIQQKAIPAILDGQDILAGAQTGTGKTAAFTLPVLHILSKQNRKRRVVRGLILTPTRELAAQVAEKVEDYGSQLHLKSAVIFGGVKQGPQVKKIRQGLDILIATPGRLLDLVQQNELDLKDVEIFILDEADRMLDMGFIHDIRKVIKYLPSDRQNMLFSATYSNDIKNLAKSLLNNPVEVEVARRNTTAETVAQGVYKVAKAHKRRLLSHLIKRDNWHQVIIFTRTKHGANKLCKQLNSDKITAEAIHGNKSQNARTRALQNFKDLKTQALVATDIAARGIDISELPYVVNFDLPNISEDYVHRIGRTGRAGSEGLAVSLVSPDENAYLRSIEKLIKRKIDVLEAEDFDPPELPKEKPQDNRPRGNRNRKTGNSQGNKNKRSNNSRNKNRSQSGDSNQQGNKPRRPKRNNQSRGPRKPSQD